MIDTSILNAALRVFRDKSYSNNLRISRNNVDAVRLRSAYFANMTRYYKIVTVSTLCILTIHVVWKRCPVSNIRIVPVHEMYRREWKLPVNVTTAKSELFTRVCRAIDRCVNNWRKNTITSRRADVASNFNKRISPPKHYPLTFYGFSVIRTSNRRHRLTKCYRVQLFEKLWSIELITEH